MGVPTLGTVAAIGTSLFLETSGFGAGVHGYLSRRLVDTRTALTLIAVTLPLGTAGAVAARHAPVELLRIVYGVAMIALAYVLVRDSGGEETEEPCPSLVQASDDSHEECPKGTARRVESTDGHIYSFCAHGLGVQRVLSGFGAFLAGLISTGVGEATLPALVRRSKFPPPVAAATSTVVVAGTVVGAAATHLVQLLHEGGLAAVPWNLLIWAVPGAILGATLGTRLQGRVSERASRYFFGALFLAIGVTFLVAFTLFGERFGG